jgi:pyruvate/2-oxoglutarate dehydrogenase complex dihydrolipoamide dehydrogenase (E3) component
MVEDLVQVHLDRYKASGAELIMGNARFIGHRTVEVSLNGGGSKVIAGKCISQFGDASGHSRCPGTRGIPTDDSRRGSGPRPFTRTSRCRGWRFCRS